eukprot:8292125-Alexandrium_andersonii.AAC.1
MGNWPSALVHPAPDASRHAPAVLVRRRDGRVPEAQGFDAQALMSNSLGLGDATSVCDDQPSIIDDEVREVHRPSRRPVADSSSFAIPGFVAVTLGH